MPPQELVAVLPLDQLIACGEVTHLEVETDCLALAGQLSQRSRDLLDNVLDSGDVRQANRGNRGKGQWLDLILEQVVDFRLIMPVETSDSFLTCLVKGDFPLHLVEEVIVENDEDWADAKFHRSSSLCVRKALVKRVPPLVCLKDWSKNSEVRDFNRFFLLLHHIPNAFCNAAPNHVEETQGLALAHFKGISC